MSLIELEALKEQIALVEAYVILMRKNFEMRKRVNPEARARAEYEIATMTGVLETLKRLQPPF